MALESFSCTAPGSLMILGEHAILYGHSAIVSAIDRKIMVTLAVAKANNLNSKHKHITIIADEIGEMNLETQQVIDLSSADLARLAVPKFNYVISALITLKPYWQDKLFSTLKLTIKADFSSKIGFGSSAAVVVATIGVVQQWLKLDLTTEELFKLAKIAVHAVASCGSGADIMASLLGGTVYFQPEPLAWQQLPLLPSITAIYAGYKTTTAKVIAIVKEQVALFPVVYQQLFQAIDYCVKQGLELISTQNWLELGKVWLLQQRLLAAIGVSTPRLDKLVQILQDHGALGAKISGSGLGDCVIAFGEIGTDIKAMLDANIGETIFRLNNNAQGLCNECA